MWWICTVSGSSIVVVFLGRGLLLLLVPRSVTSLSPTCCSWVRCLRARRICIGRYDDTSIQVGGPLESIEREHRWHAQELAEAFMERFPEDPIVFATEDWRGDRD